MNDSPYRLDEGLFLEQSGQLIPWFKSLNQITKMGGKPLPEKGKTQMLFWANEKVLGGLAVSVKALPNGLGNFLLTLSNHDSSIPTGNQFESVVSILTEKLGKPSNSGVSSQHNHPWSKWSFGSVVLKVAIAERFMDYVSISITNGAN